MNQRKHLWWLVPVWIAFFLVLAALANGQAAGPTATMNKPSDQIIKPTDPITTFVVLTWQTFAPPNTTIASVDIYHQFNGGSWSKWQTFTDTQFAIYYWQSTFNADGLYGVQAIARDSQGNTEPLSTTAEQAFRVDMANVWEDRAFLPLVLRQQPTPTLAPPNPTNKEVNK